MQKEIAPPARRRARNYLRHFGGIALVVALSLSLTACGDDNEASQSPTPRPLAVDGAAMDVHTHLMSATLSAAIGAQGGPATADDLIQRMDEAHVTRAVVLSTAYMSAIADDPAVSAENDYVAQQVGGHADRLILFCAINPLRAGALDEIDRCATDLGAKGIKLHLVGSRVDVTNPAHVDALTQVFDRIQARGLPVLLHAANPLGLPLDNDGITSLGTIMAQHTVRVVLAHCFSLLDNQQLELITEGIHQGLLSEDQMFLDISSCLETFQDAPLSERELIVWRLRKFGLERVFFGSDYLKTDPIAITPANALRVLALYPFSQEEIDLILRNDALAWLQGN